MPGLELGVPGQLRNDGAPVQVTPHGFSWCSEGPPETSGAIALRLELWILVSVWHIMTMILRLCGVDFDVVPLSLVCGCVTAPPLSREQADALRVRGGCRGAVGQDGSL